MQFSETTLDLFAAAEEKQKGRISVCHWSRGVIPVFDLETSGTDPLRARIVSAALLLVDAEGRILPGSYSTIVNPGIEIPSEAAAIHGITTERAQAEGIPPAEAVMHIVRMLRALHWLGWPLSVYNASYDWPLLLCEAERWEIPRVPPMRLVDPLVMDRHLDRYRKGGKKLEAVAAHYGVRLDDAHEAAADCLATVGVLRAICARYPALQELTLDELQTWQAEAFEEWKHGLNRYWARSGKGDRIEGEWLKPVPVGLNRGS